MTPSGSCELLNADEKQTTGDGRRTSGIDETRARDLGIAPGTVWQSRRRRRRDQLVEVVRYVESRRGVLVLVEGLTSGLQWAVTETTLIAGYHPSPEPKRQSREPN